MYWKQCDGEDMSRNSFAKLLIILCILLQAGCRVRPTVQVTPTSEPGPVPSRTPVATPLKPSPVPTETLTDVLIPRCDAAITPASSTAPTPLVTETPSGDRESSGLRTVGQIGGPTRAVAVTDNYVLVGVGPRLTVLDISDKETICERGSTQALGASVRAIAISGEVAYVAAGEAGLYLVDTSDPAQPVVVGNYNSPGYAEGACWCTSARPGPGTSRNASKPC